ncbi:hypothetical protein QR680_007042 [Steinernema hermaphroditum]|uniref:Apple domain-containing protein n=1 Tax=Steinernema hermaphroditum TaxID=289476 RepID=A0AA39LXH9_9BILA|nr:hypothetical protein QR680_007042 [Steinernema hermaphroditum]
MLRRGTTVFFWFFFGMLDGKKEAYHFRSTEKDILDIQKEFQLGDCQNKTDIIDCMKWCAMERRCAGSRCLLSSDIKRWEILTSITPKSIFLINMSRKNLKVPNRRHHRKRPAHRRRASGWSIGKKLLELQKKIKMALTYKEFYYTTILKDER